MPKKHIRFTCEIVLAGAQGASWELVERAFRRAVDRGTRFEDGSVVETIETQLTSAPIVPAGGGADADNV